jgi:hypothetical protein
METHIWAKYSKSLDPDEIKDVLTDEESDEELEDRPRGGGTVYSPHHPQKMEMMSRNPKLRFVKKLFFFYLTDMTILNAFLIHKSCGGKMTHKKFRKMLVRELIIHSQEETVIASGTSRGTPSPTVSQLSRLEVKHSQHWTSKGKKRRFRVFSLPKQTRMTKYFCRKCDIGLCIEKLLQGIAYMCELASLDTKSCFECDGARQIISLYWVERKYLPCK